VSAGRHLKVLRLDPDLELPSAAYQDDAGLDLRAREAVDLMPGGGRAVVGTGVAVALPPGTAGLVLPRSGLAARHGITVANAPGLVDAGYRDEIKVILVNTDPAEPYRIERGDRIAQLVVVRFEQLQPLAVEKLPDSERGRRGHGSSGR
jgi:dUTP pyrophosphatase